MAQRMLRTCVGSQSVDEGSVKKMFNLEITSVTKDKERDIISILIDSSLYLEMSLIDRKNLVNFIMTAYC